MKRWLVAAPVLSDRDRATATALGRESEYEVVVRREEEDRTGNIITTLSWGGKLGRNYKQLAVTVWPTWYNNGLSSTLYVSSGDKKCVLLIVYKYL